MPAAARLMDKVTNIEHPTDAPPGKPREAADWLVAPQQSSRRRSFTVCFNHW